MKFIVASSINGLTEKNKIALIEDNWNDWHKYKTMYTMLYYDEDGNYEIIGSVKIGEVDLESERPHIKNDFTKLDVNFFSLGQSGEYYERLSALGGDVRDDILRSLHDIAFDNTKYFKFQNENVMSDSFMREVAQTTVFGQFHRLAIGKARLS